PGPPPPAHEIDPPPGADSAIDVVVRFYEHDIGRQLPDVLVHWTDERIEGALGKMWGCGDVWVMFGVPPVGSVFHETPLAHEITHCAHEVALGDADSDHTDIEWWTLDGKLGGALAQLELAGL